MRSFAKTTQDDKKVALEDGKYDAYSRGTGMQWVLCKG